MTRKQAEQFAEEHYPFVPGSPYCAVVCIRHGTKLLPKFGVDGSSRDASEWALLDMAEKVDTGEYGMVYYF